MSYPNTDDTTVAKGDHTFPLTADLDARLAEIAQERARLHASTEGPLAALTSEEEEVNSARSSRRATCEHSRVLPNADTESTVQGTNIPKTFYGKLGKGSCENCGADVNYCPECHAAVKRQLIDEWHNGYVPDSVIALFEKLGRDYPYPGEPGDLKLWCFNCAKCGSITYATTFYMYGA